MHEETIFKEAKVPSLEQNLKIGEELIKKANETIISSNSIIPYEKIIEAERIAKIYKSNQNPPTAKIIAEVLAVLKSKQSSAQVTQKELMERVNLDNYLEHSVKHSIIRKAVAIVFKEIQHNYLYPSSTMRSAITNLHTGECDELTHWAYITYLKEYDRDDITIVHLENPNNEKLNHAFLLIGPHSRDLFVNDKINFTNFDPRCVIIDPFLRVCCKANELHLNKNKINQYLKSQNISKMARIISAMNQKLNFDRLSADIDDATIKLKRQVIIDTLNFYAPIQGYAWKYNYDKKIAFINSNTEQNLSIIKDKIKNKYKIPDEDILISRQKNSELFTLMLRNITYNTIDPFPFKSPTTVQTLQSTPALQ
jgi:hemerythrin